MRLQDEVEKMRQENTRLSEEIFNAQALAALAETEIKHESERRIKSLESTLAFKEQEMKTLIQQHAVLLENEKKRRYSDVSGGMESKRESEYFERNVRSVGTNTSIESFPTALSNERQREDDGSIDRLLILPLLREIHSILRQRLILGTSIAADSSSPSNRQQPIEAKQMNDRDCMEALCNQLEMCIGLAQIKSSGYLHLLLPSSVRLLHSLVQTSLPDHHSTSPATPLKQLRYSTSPNISPAGNPNIPTIACLLRLLKYVIAALTDSRDISRLPQNANTCLSPTSERKTGLPSNALEKRATSSINQEMEHLLNTLLTGLCYTLRSFSSHPEVITLGDALRHTTYLRR